MLFTSISFLYYFLPIVLLIYFVAPKKVKNYVLLIASLLFYFYGEPKYLVLMIIDIFIAYIGAILIDKYRKKTVSQIFIIIPLVILGIYKYLDFVIININNILGSEISLFNITLPIGISFYTFQILSYVIDVYRKKVKVQKNFFKLAMYVSLFPQLIAGPIVRYETIEDELENRKHSFSDIAYGIRRFVIGLAKKVLVANMLGEFTNVFNNANEKTQLLYLLFALSYTLQIYFDFSAYSDMAIGLGRIFGFHFLENFNYPYIAKSITEFWRRWHISLSLWFKDYLYIPLGGNRCGKLKLVRNILIVWLLTGIWHGASWNFVLWGIFFGVILVIEKLWLGKLLEKLPNILKRIYVLVLVTISFIIFNGNTLTDVFNNIKGIFGINTSNFVDSYTLYYLKSYLVVFVIGIIGATPVLKNIIEKLNKNEKINSVINILEILVTVILLLVVTAYLVDSSYNPFLYFRF